MARSTPFSSSTNASRTLIVLKGDPIGAAKLREVLHHFTAVTGLSINYDKSTLVPIHMEEQLVSDCVGILGRTRDGFPQPYLGLPLSINKLPLSAFTPYIQKTDKYLCCWQTNLLNTMGRAVLVNSVLDSLLVYLMSSLQLPPSIIHQLDRKRRAFLWSGEKTGASPQSRCLVAWTNVCCPKESGGLGIKDFGTQNICLLLKLIHRLHCTQASA